MATVSAYGMFFQFETSTGSPAVGYKLFTYAAGSSTKQATYTSSSGSTPAANPIILDANGVAQFWGDITLAYKLVLAPANSPDPPTSTVYTEDNFYFGLTYNQFQSLVVGAPVFKTIPAETNLGLSPNQLVPYGYPERYAVNTTPQTTDMTVAVQTAITISIATGIDTLLGLTGGYLITSPLLCGFTGSANQPGYSIRMFGASGGDAGFGILFRATGNAIFDMTGADGVKLYDIATRTDATTFPTFGVLWAKNNAGSGTSGRMVNCRIYGYFAYSAQYNYGADDMVYEGNRFLNQNTAAGTKVSVFSAYNVGSATSTFGIATGAKGMFDISYNANWHQNQAGTTTTDGLYLEAQSGFRMDEGYIFCGSNSVNARAGIYVDGSNALSSNIYINGITIDTSSFLQANGILFSNDSVTHVNVVIENCRIASATYAIADAGSNPTFSSLAVRNINEPSSKGIHISGTVTGWSMLLTGGMLVNIGTANGLVIVGSAAQWTFGTITGANNRFLGTAGQTAGFGTPTGAAVLANFPGASATLAQCSAAIAEIYTLLLADGRIAS